MINCLRAYLFIFVLFLNANSFAQSRYQFFHLGARDGLLEENLNAVQQDRKGFIWIASQNGLQRYDGHRLKTFLHDPSNPSSIPSGGIRSICMDSKNRLWLVSGKSVTGYFDVNTFTFHKAFLRESTGNISSVPAVLQLTRDSGILLVAPGNNFYTYNEKKNEFSEEYNEFKIPDGWKLNHFWQDANRNYWVGTTQGLIKYNPVKKLLSYRGHNEENDKAISKFADVPMVSFVYVDRSGKFWISAWPPEGMFIKSFDPGTGITDEWQHKILKELKGVYYELYAITELQNGIFLLSGQNLLAGINAFNKLELIPGNIPGENSIRYDNINSLFEDREGNVWICSNKGLFRFNPSSQLFRVVNLRVPLNDSIFSPDVTDILQLPDGEIMAGTWGEGTFTFNEDFEPVASKYFKRNLPDGVGMVWCITRRKNGDIWRGVQNGNLFVYGNADKKITRYQLPVFEKSTIRQAEEDIEGNMWLGTHRGTIIKWSASSNTFSAVQQLRSTVLRIFTDKDNIWVCTEKNGVFRLRPDGSIAANYTSGNDSSSILGIGATGVLRYNDSIVVIASEGLNFLNTRTGKFTYFTTEKGLPSANISNLILDREGFVWMTTGNGVASYHLIKRRLSIYNSADGVHTNMFSVGSSSMLNNGSLAFGTNHDLIVVDPARVNNLDYKTPDVVIAGVSVMNKPLQVDSLIKLQEIRLKHSENSIDIDLATLSFQNIFPIVYKMEGLDDKWKQAGSDKQINYNYLPPGNYVFKAASPGVDGKLGKVTSLNIFIAKPFWNTWWFYSLIALAVFFIFYLADRQRLRRIRKEQNLRSGIAANLHDEINTTLLNINVLSEIAGLKADVDPRQTKDFIHEIKEKSRNMVTAMDDMLWSIDPANDNMSRAIDRIREYTDAMKATCNAEISVQVDEGVKKINLDMKKRYEFMAIYKLALETLVGILRSEQTTVQIDHGKGFLNLRIFSGVTNIFQAGNAVIKNINLIKKHASVLNTEVDIVSDNQGTSIQLAIKV